MKEFIHTNRDGDNLTFIVLDDTQTIIINGLSGVVGLIGENPITAIDPSGGPYIEIDMDINKIILSDEEFKRTTTARIVKTIEFASINIILHFKVAEKKAINKQQTKHHGNTEH